MTSEDSVEGCFFSLRKVKAVIRFLFYVLDNGCICRLLILTAIAQNSNCDFIKVLVGYPEPADWYFSIQQKFAVNNS